MGAADEQIIQSWQVIQSWQDRAQAYQTITERYPLFGQLSERLVDLLPAAFSGTLIDLAAGTGLSTECVLTRYPHAQVYLVEPAQAMLALALQRVGERISGHAQLAAEELGKLSVQADAVVCSAAMHLLDETQVFPQVASCLKPGGLFVFNLWWHSWEVTAHIDPGPCWRAVLEQALVECGELSELLPVPSRPRVRTRQGLSQAAEQAGLSIVRSIVDTDQLPLRFFIDFAAMSEAFLHTLTPSRRAAVLKRAQAGATQLVDIQTTRFVLRRNLN